PAKASVPIVRTPGIALIRRPGAVAARTRLLSVDVIPSSCPFGGERDIYAQRPAVDHRVLRGDGETDRQRERRVVQRAVRPDRRRGERGADPDPERQDPERERGARPLLVQP